MEHKQIEFDDETIEALKRLGEAILAVRTRLLSEGYTIVDGKYVPPPTDGGRDALSTGLH